MLSGKKINPSLHPLPHRAPESQASWELYGHAIAWRQSAVDQDMRKPRSHAQKGVIGQRRPIRQFAGKRRRGLRAGQTGDRKAGLSSVSPCGSYMLRAPLCVWGGLLQMLVVALKGRAKAPAAGLQGLCNLKKAAFIPQRAKSEPHD